jgi:phosphate:Na+ symporter
MSAQDIFMLLFQVLGGLSLFIYGMNVMTSSLREAAGSSLRTILARATQSRVHGSVFGTMFGFLAHSGAAVAALAGFVNAGVMTLEQAIAPVFGANIGTSVSMLMISFRIADYCWVVIGIGFLLDSLIPSERWSKLGRALIGFGLLFLGMEVISTGIAPHKDALEPWLVLFRGDVWTYRLLSVAFSALLTALMTSSGAMIGLCFALIKAGMFTEFEQAAVVILGAHIGTCIVPIVAALPMSIGAWRVAIAHLWFNVLHVILFLVIWPVSVWSAKAISPDLLAQAAYFNTYTMVVGTLLFLPFLRHFTKLVRVSTPSKEPTPAPSFLDDKLFARPEQALAGVVRELRRMAEICVDSMMLNGELMLNFNRKTHRKLLSNEEIINEVREAVSDYLGRLTKHYLSRRQTLFLQHLDRCMKDIERIGDYLTHLGETTRERTGNPEALLPEDLFNTWFNLFRTAKHVTSLMAKSFDPDSETFQTTALAILRARDAYMVQSMDAKADYADAIRNRRIAPIAGYYLARYIEDLDRMVRRIKSIAFAVQQPDFRVKAYKFRREAEPPLAYEPPHRVDPGKYLALLQKDIPYDEDDDDLPELIPRKIPSSSPHKAPPDEPPPESPPTAT